MLIKTQCKVQTTPRLPYTVLLGRGAEFAQNVYMAFFVPTGCFRFARNYEAKIIRKSDGGGEVDGGVKNKINLGF